MRSLNKSFSIKLAVGAVYSKRLINRRVFTVRSQLTVHVWIYQLP